MANNYCRYTAKTRAGPPSSDYYVINEPHAVYAVQQLSTIIDLHEESILLLIIDPMRLFDSPIFPELN